MLKIPNVGEMALLKSMLGGAPVGELIMKLYVNPLLPAADTVVNDFVEMSGQGYASRSLDHTLWTYGALANVAEATHVAHEWVFSGGGPTPIYGYYIVGAVDGVLRWTEAFSPVFSAEVPGDKLTVTPKITFSTY